MSVSEVAIFILILVRLIPTSQNMANQRQMIASSRPSLHKVINVIKESADKQENLDIGKNFTDKFEAINILNSYFAYPKSKVKALSKVTCSIPRHKKTAIIGRSGSENRR